MNTKITKSIMALGVLGSTLSGANAFASSADYGIVYSGGQNLGSGNVTINQSLIDGLSPLIKVSSKSNQSTKNNSAKWNTAYMKDGEVCRTYYYAKVSQDAPIVESDNLGFTVVNERYQADVSIKSVTSEDLGAKVTAIGFVPELGFIYGGWRPYTDAACTTPVEGVKALTSRDSDDRIFVNTVIKMHKKNETTPVKSDQLYFGITDIDAAQSFKILNADNQLSPTNMFAKNADDLQPTETALRNKFVASGNYIYSEYVKSGDSSSHIATDGISNIYVKLTEATQEEGVNIVYGFVQSAGSGLEYFAKQYKVTYISDENGKITGIADEQVIAGENPTGSKQEPNEGYEDSNWVANVDVKLADGSTIKAGEPLTSAQIATVVVDQDITFTAIHVFEETPVAAPDTGSNTQGIEGAQLATISIVAVLLCGLSLRALPRIVRKKVGFN